MNTRTPSNYRRTLSASTLIGDKVSNPEGENLGHLKEIMIDLTNGRVAYGVLDFGGFLGLGDKYFAIPWEAFSVDEAARKLVLNVDKERLKSAEGFDKDNWPDFADPEWGGRIYDYYGYPRYWDEI